MFIKLYDSDRNYLALLDDLKDIEIVSTLESGVQKLSFSVPVLSQYLNIIQEEEYIETSDYNYVIKEISLDDNNFYRVYCNPDYEDLYGTLAEVFDCHERNPLQAYTYCLSFIKNTGWTIDYRSTNRTIITLQEKNVMVLDMIEKIAEIMQQELWFDTKAKKIIVSDRLGNARSQVYYSNELRLRKLAIESSTYDYATILLPIGKNGLTIKDVNNGSPYLKNNTYSNKTIIKVWENTDYDVPELLMGAGLDYLDKIAQPVASYKLSLAELGDVGLGDAITIVDKIKRIKQLQRVVQITRYPDKPEQDSVCISNLPTTLSRTFVQGEKQTQKQLDYLKTVIQNLT